MISNPQDYVQACAKVGELIGLIVVSRLLQAPIIEAAPRQTEPQKTEDLLSIEQAAKVFDVSRNTFLGFEKRKLISRIPGLGPRTVRFRKADVERLKKRLRE